MKLLAVIAAITLASFTAKPRDWVISQCYNSPAERNSGLNQCLAAMIFSGQDIVGYEIRNTEDGKYCFEIHYGFTGMP